MSKKKTTKRTRTKRARTKRAIDLAVRDSTRQDENLTVRNYQVRFETFDEKSRSVEAVIATEAPVLVFDLRTWTPVLEVLLMDGVKLPESRQVPLLDTHDRTTVKKVVGSTRELVVKGGELIGRNYFGETGLGEDSFKLTRGKHITDNSVGYRVTHSTMVEPGQTRTVKGRQFTAPKERALKISTSWIIRENSICAVGADSGAKNRSDKPADAGHKRKLFLMRIRTMNFEKWLEKRGLVLEDLTEDQATALRSDFDAEQNRVAVVAANEKIDTEGKVSSARDEGAELERVRQETIRKMGADAAMPEELITKAIADSVDIEAARAVFFEAMKARQLKAATIHMPVGAVRDVAVSAKLLEAGTLIRAGYGDFICKDKDYGEEITNQADMHFRDTNLRQLCEDSLSIEGKVVPRRDNDLFERAFSTVTLPKLLGNIANKAVLRGYIYAIQTWKRWCTIGTATDFKEMTRVRVTDADDLKEVGNSGEVEHGTVVEEYEQYSITTFSKQFAVTRKNIINDDLGALTRTPERLGRKANQKPAQLVYMHLLANGNMSDNVALFHADHKNLNTSAALAADKLAAAVTAFRNMTDADGEPLDIAPKILLVPPTLENTAKGLATSELIVVAYGGETARKDPTKNIFKELALIVVVEPRLENAAYPGAANNDWYLAGDPAQCDTIEVAFLNGRQEPIVERFDAGINVLGVGYRVVLDVGCKSLDFRGMQKNEG